MIKINDLKAQLQDTTIVNAEMRALLNKAKGKSVDTKFEKPSVVRQPNDFRFQNLSALGKSSPFENSPENNFFHNHGKANRSAFKTKTIPSLKGRLHLLHMDLCFPMRVESINEKKYILVFIDNYSRYTWTHFLRSKDKTPDILIDFLKMIQRGLQDLVINVRTDKGTKFLIKTLHTFFKENGISHQTTAARTPEQNDVIERWNRTLVEAARTMLSASKLPFFWAEAILTAFKDGENLDNMKEKGIREFLSGLIPLRQMTFDHNNSNLAPQQKKASDYDNSGLAPHIQEISPPAEKTDTSLQELELLFSPMFLKCMFTLTVSNAEPKNIKEAMADHAWIEAMQEELYQFDRLKVWELVDKPFGKIMINLKWLWKNKKDKDNTIIRDKARLVAKGYRQEEDGFIDPNHPVKVYRIRKALYGLKQALRALYDAFEIFDIQRPYLVQEVCYCARYQARPTEKHLKEVKRIFRYLKKTINMGLWYSKDFDFQLTAFLDADHAGCPDIRKSTSGGIQFLGDKLISWMSKKHDCTAMSTAEAEYVTLSASCAQEPDNSLSMGDEHLDTILATESDEFIKSGVENLIPILSESEGIPEHVCDVPFHDNSPPLDISQDTIEYFFESNEEFSSTGDDSFSLDNIDYVEASPPDSELVSLEVMEIVIPEVDAFLAVEDEFTSSQFLISYLDPEGDMLLFEAFLNDDHSSDFKTKSSSTSLNSLLEETSNFDNSVPEFTTFSKVLFDAECESDSNDDQSCFDEDVLEKIIDSLLDEFASELTLLISIPPRIDETDCDFEEHIRLIEKLLYDNSSPRPPEDFVSANSDAAKIKSFSPSPILVKDSDSLMEEIDLFCTLDYPMPSSIENKDYDSERDILIRKDLPSNNSLSFAAKVSFHFAIPRFSRPPAKPPDGDTGILNIKMMGDIFDQKAFMHKLMIALASHQEKSPDLLSHRCGTVKKFNTHRSHLNICPILFHGQNNPPLDVFLFYFYPF
nr:hypothetical protein [Tanacetum cinerariifolium]